MIFKPQSSAGAAWNTKASPNNAAAAQTTAPTPMPIAKNMPVRSPSVTPVRAAIKTAGPGLIAAIRCSRATAIKAVRVKV